MTSSTGDWTTAPLVALDLEGSGAQDRDNEAILEIAVVALPAGHPDTASAYTTLINPGRAIPRRPWISPGLTTAVLSAAPGPADVEPELANRINGHVLVGHNIGVDWRLLHRRYPAITPTALIDTLRLVRHLKLGTKNSLAALTTQLELTTRIERLAAGSRPHRALWDTIAVALLLPALVERAWPTGVSLADVLDVAGIERASPAPAKAAKRAAQDSLFDPAT
jgi:DNA polymerase III epsilon subunit-like protein